MAVPCISRARRAAHSLEPRDDLRYGYRFWLDAQTALPLKTQLVTRAGEVLEDISFLSIALPDKIDDEQLKPGFDTSGFHWMRGRRADVYARPQEGAGAAHELMPAGSRAYLHQPRGRGEGAGDRVPASLFPMRRVGIGIRGSGLVRVPRRMAPKVSRTRPMPPPACGPMAS